MSEQATSLTSADQERLDRFAESMLRESPRPEVIAPMPGRLERGALWLIAGAVAVTFLFLWFGQAHVVVKAKGRIVPEGDVRGVQALQGGVVSGVLVAPGDHVQAGQPLLRIDVSEAGLSLEQMKRRQETQRAQLQALQASLPVLEAALAGAAAPRTVPPHEPAARALAGLREAQDGLARAQRQVADLPERIALRRQELTIIEQRIATLERTVASDREAVAQVAVVAEQVRAIKDSVERIERKIDSPQ